MVGEGISLSVKLTMGSSSLHSYCSPLQYFPFSLPPTIQLTQKFKIAFEFFSRNANFNVVCIENMFQMKLFLFILCHSCYFTTARVVCTRTELNFTYIYFLSYA